MFLIVTIADRLSFIIDIINKQKMHPHPYSILTNPLDYLLVTELESRKFNTKPSIRKKYYNHAGSEFES